MVFRMEVWKGRYFADGSEQLAVIDLSEAAAEDELAVEAASQAAQTTAQQMLAKFGVSDSLTVVCIPNAMTSEEIDAEAERAHQFEAAGGTLPSTDDVLNSI